MTKVATISYPLRCTIANGAITTHPIGRYVWESSSQTQYDHSSPSICCYIMTCD